MTYGPQSHRIISALRALHSVQPETRFARLKCAKSQGRGGFMRLSYLIGNYNNGQAIIKQRSTYQHRT
jgi:hypothetical protein